MKIRKFRKGDAGKVSNVLRLAQQVMGRHYSKECIEMFCRRNTPSHIIKKSKEYEMFVAVEGGKIFGVNGLKGNQVRKFYVNPKYHRKGIGRKLMENVEGIARKRGVKKLRVQSSLYAVGFYKKCGFKPVKRVMSRLEGFTFPEMRMEKELK